MFEIYSMNFKLNLGCSVLELISWQRLSKTETNTLKIIYFYYMKTQYGQYKTFLIWSFHSIDKDYMVEICWLLEIYWLIKFSIEIVK